MFVTLLDPDIIIFLKEILWNIYVSLIVYTITFWLNNKINIIIAGLCTLSRNVGQAILSLKKYVLPLGLHQDLSKEAYLV